MPPKRNQLPAPSAPASPAPSTPALLAMAQVAKTSTDPLEVNDLRELSTSLVQAVMLSKNGRKVGDALYAAAELQAWSCRRLGQLYPAKQGERNDVPTSAGATAEVACPVKRDALKNYRKLAAIPEAKYSAAIAELKEQELPPTQGALLEYAPKAKPKERQILVEKTASRLMARAVAGLSDRAGELRELRDRAPDFHRKDLTSRIEQVLAARQVLEGKLAEIKVEETARAVLEATAKALERAAEAMRRVFDATPPGKDADAVEGFLVELEDDAIRYRSTAAGLGALGLDTSDRRALDARAQKALSPTPEAQRGPGPSPTKGGAR